MILIDWLKRQARNFRKKVQEKIGVSPSRAFAVTGAKFYHGFNVPSDIDYKLETLQ